MRFNKTVTSAYFLHSTFVTESTFLGLILTERIPNINPMETPDPEIRKKIERVQNLLAMSLKEKDAWHLNFLISNKLTIPALKYLFEVIEKTKPITDSETDDLLMDLSKNLSSVLAEEKETAEINLSDTEIVSRVFAFMNKYEVQGEMDVGTIQYSTHYFDIENEPHWTIDATLQPPSSMANRKVRFYILAKTKDVEMMLNAFDLN